MATPYDGEKGVGAITAQTALNASTATKILSTQNRTFGEVRNLDAAISIYIGGAEVSSSNGYLLKAGESFGLENFVGEFYAIAASGTPSVATIRW